MTTISVMYVGQKPRKADNIAGSGLVWRGHGDVQEATPGQWAAFSSHPDVWVRADEVSTPTNVAVNPVASAAATAASPSAPAQDQQLQQIQPSTVAAQPIALAAAPSAQTPEPAAPAAPAAPAVSVEAAAPVADPVTAGLYGSDVLDSIIDIGGQPVQLGTIVAAAHQSSGLSVDDWNGLVPSVRDQLLADQIATMRAAAAGSGDAPGANGADGADGAGDPAADQAADPAAPKAARQRRTAAAPTGEVS